jgi:hypothetical protein
MSRFVIAKPRRGRYVAKIKHTAVCAVIDRSGLGACARAEQLLDWPTFKTWRDNPRGAA